MNKVNYDTFMTMLGELNDYILDIRAIGGFSMIIHKKLGHIKSPREESCDIDSLTEDYPDEIILKIKEIGKKYEADDPDGWLNNHWNRTKKYNEEFAFFIRWDILEDADFSNINLYYADLQSLFMFKIRAMDNRIELAKLEPREQDVLDAVSILRAFEITNLDHIEDETVRNTIPYFPYAVNYLIDNNMIKGTKIEIKINKENKIKFEDTDYGKKLAEQAEKYNINIESPDRNGHDDQ